MSQEPFGVHSEFSVLRGRYVAVATVLPSLPARLHPLPSQFLCCDIMPFNLEDCSDVRSCWFYWFYSCSSLEDFLLISCYCPAVWLLLCYRSRTRCRVVVRPSSERRRRLLVIVWTSCDSSAAPALSSAHHFCPAAPEHNTHADYDTQTNNK